MPTRTRTRSSVTTITHKTKKEATLTMCIAAISKTGGFKEQELSQFFRANRHGGGFAYAEDGKIFTHRHIMVESDYIEQGMRLADKENLVTHCRIATSGGIIPDNAHPFIMENSVLVHNGVLYGTNGTMSDTRDFVEETKTLLDDQALMDNPIVIKRLGDVIGTYNKLILLYKNKTFKIVNESQGYWKENTWYSNNHWTYAK
jgi:predicted glutamine amidotransferase